MSDARSANDALGGPAKRWMEADGLHVDVRGLPPPQPMVEILTLVRAIGDDTAVIAHLDRDPQMLYPELAELGWTAEPIDAAPGEVRLRLARAT